MCLSTGSYSCGRLSRGLCLPTSLFNIGPCRSALDSFGEVHGRVPPSRDLPRAVQKLAPAGGIAARSLLTCGFGVGVTSVKPGDQVIPLYTLGCPAVPFAALGPVYAIRSTQGARASCPTAHRASPAMAVKSSTGATGDRLNWQVADLCERSVLRPIMTRRPATRLFIDIVDSKRDYYAFPSSCDRRDSRSCGILAGAGAIVVPGSKRAEACADVLRRCV